jgi:competence protein ComEC
MVIAGDGWRSWALPLAGRLEDIVEAERGRFLLWLPVFMAAGVVAYFSLLTEPPRWIGGCALAGCLALGWLAGQYRGLQAVCWAAAALALGFASAQVETWRAAPLAVIPTHAVIVTGTVRAVEQLPNGRRILLEQPRLDGGAPLPRAIRLRLRPTDTVAVATGDRLKIRALLMRPAPPAYPGAWDLQRDAYYAGIAAYGFALNPLENLARAPPDGTSRWLQSLRETIAGRIAAVLPGTLGAIASTLLTGEGAAIPEGDREAFRDSGLAHLLAIAGLHIGIVMGLVFGGTRLALALSERAALHLPLKQIAALAALAAGGAYMLLTGAHVPIIRSFSMACMVTLGVLVGRRALSLRGLALAMATLILMAPAEVLGVSFQMSFSAVLGLIAGYEAMRPVLARLYGNGSWQRRLLGHVVALGLTSALAGTFSAPFGAYHFGHIQLYFVLANMAAVPLTAMWVMPAGLIALGLMPLHLEALALVPMGWGIAAILWIGREVSSWPGAVLAVPHMPAWGLGVLSLGIAWLGLWRSRLRLAGIAAILLGFASPMLVQPPDLLISADARLIAMRTEAGIYVQKQSGASRFTQESWQQLLAEQAGLPLPASGDTADGAITCTEVACVLRGHGSTATLLRGSTTPDTACAASLLVSAQPIRLTCPAAIPTIDRFSVWRDGAHAVWLDVTGPRILSDRQFRGDRPWVLQASSTAGRVAPGLVPAQSE